MRFQKRRAGASCLDQDVHFKSHHGLDAACLERTWVTTWEVVPSVRANVAMRTKESGVTTTRCVEESYPGTPFAGIIPTNRKVAAERINRIEPNCGVVKKVSPLEIL